MSTCKVGKTKSELKKEVYKGIIRETNPNVEEVLRNSSLNDDDLFAYLIALHTSLKNNKQIYLKDHTEEQYTNKLKLVQYAIDNMARLRKIPARVVEDKAATIDIVTGKIPVFGKGLNDYFREDMTREPFKALIYNPNALAHNKIRMASMEIKAVIDYQNALFLQIKNYLVNAGYNVTLPGIYDEEGNIISYDDYSQVMEAAMDVVKANLNNLKSDSFDKQLLTLYEFVKSFYILNNFDDFIDLYFSDYITVNQSEHLHGSLNINRAKYKYTVQTKAFVSWNGDHSDHDANKNFGKLFFQFLRTVNVKGGRPLTMDDFHKIAAYIQNRFTPEQLDIFYNGNDEEVYTLLADNAENIGGVLSGTNGSKFIAALIFALKENQEALRDEVGHKSLRAQQHIYNNLDFLAAFRAEVQNSTSKTYIKETAESIDIESNALLKQSKEAVRARLLAVTLNNIRNGNFQLYSPNWFHIQKGINLFDPAFRTMFRHLTGFELTDEKTEYLRDLSNNQFDAVLQYLRDFCNFVYTKVLISQNPEQTLNDYLRSSTNNFNPSWVAFSSVCVSENYVDSSKIRNQANDQIPNATTSALGLDTKYNIARYIKQIGDDAKGNILISNPELMDTGIRTPNPQHIVSRLDVSYKDGKKDKVITATELNPIQNTQMAINNEYFLSYLENGIVYNQITCTSNKKNIILGAYNVSASDFFNKAKTKDLYDRWLQQHHMHYDALYNKLLEDYNLVLKQLGNPEVSTIDDAIKILQNYFVKDILKAVRNYNVSNPDNRIELFKELHYSEGEDKKFRINPYLYANMCRDDGDDPYVSRNKFLNTLQGAAFKDFLKTAVKIKIPDWIRNNDFIDKNAERVAWLFNVGNEKKNIDAIKAFIKNNKYWVTSKSKETDLGYQAMRKYFVLSNLFTDADLFLVSKHKDIQDKGKPMELNTLKTLLGELTSDNIYSDQKYAPIKNIIRAKINSDAKRSNIWNAPLTKQRRSKFGLNKKVNIAIVEHLKSEIAMFDGKTDMYNANDGVIQTLGVATYWEKSSFPGRTFGDTKKTFCAAPSAFTITQIKCADFAITNSVIRNSFKVADENKQLLIQNQNIVNRVKKMMSAGTFSDYFYKDKVGINLVDGLGINTAKYTDDGVLRYLTSMQIVPETHSFTFTWANVNDVTKKTTETVVINNVYDLYQELGGYYSFGKDENGEWNESETSQEFISLFVTQYDNAVKDRIIHKVGDQEAIKSAVGNFNYKEDVEDLNTPLNYISIDVDLFGVQSDQSHESDEDTVPALTQLVSNLSLNGAHPELVKELLQTIQLSLQSGINRLNKPWDGTEQQLRELTKQVAEQLVRSLRNGISKVSDLENIATKVLTDYAEGKEIQFAYSSKPAFRKVASNLLVDLNKNVLRTRFPGTPVINNPSYGVYGIYEDSEGNVFKEDDLIKQAIASLTAENINGYEGDNFISKALNAAKVGMPTLQDTVVTNAAELEIEDTVLVNIKNKEGKDILTTIRITNPTELYDIERRILSGEDVYKVYDRKRNLKAPNITWTENGIKKSLWFSPAVKERYRLMNDPNATEAQKQLYLLWHRACLVGLENGYYYKTIEDFKTKTITPIDEGSYVYKPGEQILPKRFKTVLGLGNTSMAEVLQQGPDFFLTKAENNILAKNPAKFTEEDKDTEAIVTLVRPQDEILFREVKRDSEIKITRSPFIEHDVLENKYYYTTPQGERLFTVPSNDCGVTEQTIDGKKVYVVTTKSELYDTIRDIKDVTAYYREVKLTKYKGEDVIVGNKYDKLLTRKNTLINTLDKNDESIRNSIDKYQNNLFNSFKLYNETISARIPTQAFQSFAVLKTVAFTDFDTNDGYINAYLTFFQGADFDIDKSYTLMFANKKDGTIETISPLVQIDTKEHYLDGMATLPYPDSNLIVEKPIDEQTLKSAITLNDLVEILGDDFKLYIDGNRPEGCLESYLLGQINTGNITKYYDAINKVQTLLKEHIVGGKIYSTIDFTSLNKHNSYHVTTDGYKNKITSLIYKVASSSANLDASQVPMSSDPILKLIDECEQETVTLRNTRDKVEYNPYNPITKWELQFQAKVGNETTGIAANALKATAAEQQYYNEGYQDWKLINTGDEVDYQKSYDSLPESYRFGTNKTLQSAPKNAKNYQPVTDRTGLVLDISVDGKNTGNRTIVKRNYVRLGDTVLDKNEDIARQKYNILHEGITFDTIKQWKEYVWLNEYRAKDPKLMARLKDNKDSGLKNLITAVEVYADMHSTTVEEVLNSILGSKGAFLDFMFFAENFRMKVADSISIFISLAVDNMKELALARMRTNADFLGMALGMLSLGIEPRDVVDTCINVIDPIFVARQANVLQGEENPDIDRIIDDLLKEKKIYNAATARSLHTLRSYAQDMRAMTDLFSVNQGVPATFTTIMQFLRNKAHNKTTKEAEALIDPQNKATWIKNYVDTHFSSEEERQRITNLLNEDIDFRLLYKDNNYKQALEAYFNQFKTGFNIISIITGNPNFTTLLQALSIQVSQIAKIGIAGKFTKEAVKLFPEKFHLSDGDVSKILSVCDNFLIGETLKKLNSDPATAIEFSYNSAGVRNPKLIGKDAVLSLSTEGGVNEFIKIMNDNILPKLKDETYTDNLFFQYMRPQRNNATGKLYWDIPIDGFDSNDVVNRQLLEDVAKSLSDIASDPSGFKTLSGKNLTVGELLTLYVMIDNGFKLGSALSTCIERINQDYQYKIYDIYNQVVIDYDNKTRRYTTDKVLNPTTNLVEVVFVEQRVGKDGKTEKVETEETKLLTEQLKIAKAYIEGNQYKSKDIKSAYIYQFIEQPKLKLSDIISSFGIDKSSVSVEADTDGNRKLIIPIGKNKVEINLPVPGVVTDINYIYLTTEDAIVLNHTIKTNKNVRQAISGEWDIPSDLKATIAELTQLVGLKNYDIVQTPFNNTLTSTAPYIISPNPNTVSITLDSNLVSIGYFKDNVWAVVDMIAEASGKLTALEKVNFYKAYFENYFDKLKKPEQKSPLVSYIEHLQKENTPQYREIAKVNQILGTLNEQLENKEVYYKPINQDITGGFIIGDIVNYELFGNAIECIYLGKINGKDMFVTPSGKPSIYTDTTKMKLKYRLKTSPGHLYRHFIVGNTTYSRPETDHSKPNNNLDNINRGYKVTLNNNVYYVSEVFYEDDSLESVVLQDSNNKFKLVTKAGLQQAKIAKPILQKNISDYNMIIQNVSGFETTKKFIQSRLEFGSKITFNNQGISLTGTVSKLLRNKENLVVSVEDANGKTVTYPISIDDVLELHLPANLYLAEPEMMFNLQITNNSKFNFINVNNPLLMAGYTKVQTLPQVHVGDVIIDNSAKSLAKNTVNTNTTQDNNGNIDVATYKAQMRIPTNTNKVNRSYKDVYVVSEINGKNILYKKYKLEILEDRTRVSTNVISVEFTGSAPEGDYFTKNRDSIISDRLPKKNRTTNPVNLQEKVIDYLEQTLGVTIAIDDSLNPGEAMVKGGMILMNRSDFNGDDFLKLTVHELSHIVLAYIKLKNPDQYYTLLEKYAPNLKGKDGKNILSSIPADNQNYITDDLKKEEAIVRFLETQLSSTTLDVREENQSIAEQLATIINGAFSEMFKTVPIEANNLSRQITLKSLLETSNLFEDFVEELDFDTLKVMNAYNKYLDGITIECN